MFRYEVARRPVSLRDWPFVLGWRDCFSALLSRSTGHSSCSPARTRSDEMDVAARETRSAPAPVIARVARNVAAVVESGPQSVLLTRGAKRRGAAQKVREFSALAK